MNAILSLHHSGMSEEGIQELVFALTRSVQEETDLTASPFVPEETGDPGINGDAKGDPNSGCKEVRDEPTVDTRGSGRSPGDFFAPKGLYISAQGNTLSTNTSGPGCMGCHPMLKLYNPFGVSVSVDPSPGRSLCVRPFIPDGHAVPQV